MCTPYQWHLRATLRYQVLKQRMGAARAPSHHDWCGVARAKETYLPPLEELAVLGVATRPATLDIVHPKRAQALRDLHLFIAGERYTHLFSEIQSVSEPQQWFSRVRLSRVRE